MTKTNLELTQQIYAHFAKRDFEAAFTMFTDDVKFVVPGSPDIPYAGVFNGKEEVARFYKFLLETMQVTSNEIKSFTTDGDKVFVQGAFAGVATPTGKPFQSDWLMIWTFENGKMKQHDIFSDTNNLANALRK
jgi:ketosteroid isomerase-like protein